MTEFSHFERLVIQKRFQSLRRRQIVGLGALIVSTALFVLASRDAYVLNLGVRRLTLGLIALAGIAGSIVFCLINWRCPSCGRTLGRSIYPRICSNCTAPLAD